MEHKERLSQLIRDFVFRDRRIADQPSLRINVFLAEGDILRRVATSSDVSGHLPDPTFGIGEGVAGKAFSRMSLAPVTSAVRRERGDDRIRSVISCPVIVSDRPLGALSLDSQIKLEFNPTDIQRIQVLGALVAYDVFHLQQRITARSRLSEELGRVLRGAREEPKLTQNDLAGLVGTSRIALARWESGAQPPRAVHCGAGLERWAFLLVVEPRLSRSSTRRPNFSKCCGVILVGCPNSRPSSSSLWSPSCSTE